ncbi:MAG: type II secretion system major pseudopilin GspG [Verrucomicrobiales bacterium]
MKITIQNLKKTRTGAFSLVEMVIVITIIGILAAATVVGVGGFVDDARMSAAELGIEQLGTALLSYEGQNYSRPPTQEQGLMALHEKPTSEPMPKRWRAYVEEKEQLLDPWGNEFQYRMPSQKSKKRYDVFSLGKDGVESDDDVGNW